MDKQLIKVTFDELTVPACAYKYYETFSESEPLLKYDEELMPFTQNEIPFAYRSARDGRYFMFKNFVHLRDQKFESIFNKEVEIILCDKPTCVETEIATYFLNLLQLNRSPSNSPNTLIKMIQLCLPRVQKRNKDLKFSRRGIASMSNLSENVIRSAMHQSKRGCRDE